MPQIWTDSVTKFECVMSDAHLVPKGISGKGAKIPFWTRSGTRSLGACVAGASGGAGTFGEGAERRDCPGEFEFCARLEKQPEAQEALESGLLAKMETLKSVHVSWMLDQDEIVQKRDELHWMPCVRHAYWRDCHWLGPAPVPGEIGWHQHQFQGLHVNTDNEQLLVRMLGDGFICVNGCMVGDAGQLLCDGDRLEIEGAHIRIRKMRAWRPPTGASSSEPWVRFLRAQRLTHCERTALRRRCSL